eukprot:GFUD01065893.1.p1 GENE.GFUD01065893.1~~GFUD01065893.1.p1  ORF type:complete len:104 (-),score=21.95 GFUD01065893.1:88-399(-)
MKTASQREASVQLALVLPCVLSCSQETFTCQDTLPGHWPGWAMSRMNTTSLPSSPPADHVVQTGATLLSPTIRVAVLLAVVQDCVAGWSPSSLHSEPLISVIQ